MHRELNVSTCEPNTSQIKKIKDASRLPVHLFILITLGSAALYALMSAFIKIAAVTGDVAAVVTSRYAFSCAALLPLYLASGKPTIRTTRLRLHLLRGLTSFAIFVLYTLALQRIPLQNAIVLNSSYVLFLPLLSFILMRTRVSLTVMIGLVLGFGGVVAIAGTPSTGYLDYGSMLALASAVATAGSTTMIAKLRSTENSFSIVFYFFCIAFMLSLVWFAFSGASIPTTDIWLMVLVGVLGVSYQFLFTVALKHISSELASSVMNVSILFGFVLDYFMFHGLPAVKDLLGSVLILGGILVVIWSSSKDTSTLMTVHRTSANK